MANVATKQDVTELESQMGEVESSLTTKIGEVESSLTTKIGEVESSLTAKMGELDASVTTRMGELESSVTTKMGELDASLAGRMDAMEKRLSWEIAHAINAGMEHVASLVRVVDDKYTNVPEQIRQLWRAIDDLRVERKDR